MIYEFLQDWLPYLLLNACKNWFVLEIDSPLVHRIRTKDRWRHGDGRGHPWPTRNLDWGEGNITSWVKMFNLLSNCVPDFLVIQTKGNKYELCFPKIKFKMMLNYGSDEDEYVGPTKSVRQVMFLPYQQNRLRDL